MKHLLMLIGGLLISLTLAGCAPASPPQRVEVTLTDYAFDLPNTEFKVGQPYEFVVTNQGAIPHEFVIMRPHTEDEVATEGDAGHDMRDALVEVTEDELPPGASITVTYTFTKPVSSDELEIACHIAGHYEQGMHQPITVVN